MKKPNHRKKPWRVLAIGAHPDDIEFMMGGTLLLLAGRGCEIHYWNMLNGSMGTRRMDAPRAIQTRLREAKDAALLAGAVFHPPLFNDLDAYYDAAHLARASSVVRQIAPDIALLQSPSDYMEDHQNVVRLAVTALFTRGMRNFKSKPRRLPVEKPCALYHALPHGLCDSLGVRLRAEYYADIRSVLGKKKALLACHQSQRDWLSASQNMEDLTAPITAKAREVGLLSKKFGFAEGWRRHHSAGFGYEDRDPLRECLGSAIAIDPTYARMKKHGFPS